LLQAHKNEVYTSASDINDRVVIPPGRLDTFHSVVGLTEGFFTSAQVQDVNSDLYKHTLGQIKPTGAAIRIPTCQPGDHGAIAGTGNPVLGRVTSVSAEFLTSVTGGSSNSLKGWIVTVQVDGGVDKLIIKENQFLIDVENLCGYLWFKDSEKSNHNITLQSDCGWFPFQIKAFDSSSSCWMLKVGSLLQPGFCQVLTLPENEIHAKIQSYAFVKVKVELFRFL